MRLISRQLRATAWCAVLLVPMSACDAGTMDTPDAGPDGSVPMGCEETGPEVASVTIDDADADVMLGESRELTVTVTTACDADSSVTWETSDPSIATVDAAGRITGVGIGAFMITATSVVDPTKSDSVAGFATAVPVFEGPDDRAGDEQALVDLFNATNGSGWINQTGWDGTSMSLDDEIFGVETEMIDGELRVTEIHLNYDGSHDIYHPGGNDRSETFMGNGLTGTLPESLGNLKKCRYFNVRANDIGGVLPVGIKNMRSLEHLYLAGTRVTVGYNNGDDFAYGDPSYEEGFGTVKLRTDQGFKSRFVGGLPPEWWQLPNIRVIQVGRTGEYDAMPTNHPNLDPEKEGIGGPLPPEWGLMSTLEMLDVSGNRHTGTLPSEWGNLTRLQHLRIGTNPDITGALPAEWGGANGYAGMRRMRDIGLPGINPLVEVTGGQLEGGFPPSWANMKMLKLLHAVQTFQPGAEFPYFFFSGHLRDRVATDDPDPDAVPIEAFNRDISKITFIANGFVGTEFPELSGVNPVQTKISQERDMSGDITGVDLNSLRRTVQFWLDGANFTGEWGPITNWRRCKLIIVQGNDFTGPLPEMGADNEDFRNGMFHNNRFTSIPASWGELPWSRPFVRLWLDDNQLSGPIPLGLAGKTYDGGLRLQNNRFVFRDLVPFLAAKADDSDVVYAPQQRFGEGTTLSPSAGSSVTLDHFARDVSHSQNRYQWYRDDAPIGGGTSRTLRLDDVSSSDSGDYHLEVTNPGAPDLTLESRMITVDVGD